MSLRLSAWRFDTFASVSGVYNVAGVAGLAMTGGRVHFSDPQGTPRQFAYYGAGAAIGTPRAMLPKSMVKWVLQQLDVNIAAYQFPSSGVVYRFGSSELTLSDLCGPVAFLDVTAAAIIGYELTVMLINFEYGLPEGLIVMECGNVGSAGLSAGLLVGSMRHVPTLASEAVLPPPPAEVMDPLGPPPPGGDAVFDMGVGF